MGRLPDPDEIDQTSYTTGMSYRLQHTETVDDGLRRILGEEVDAAVACARDPHLDVHDAVHQLRKRLKGARALLQLVRESLPERRAENRRYRDIARRVSESRDAASIVDAFGLVMAALPDERADALEPVRNALRERREALTAALDIPARLAWCGNQLVAARPTVDALSLRASGWDAIASGLRHWYRRGRRLWRRAEVERDTELLHEWRKCAKYHLFHLRLLEDVDPDAMRLRIDRMQALEDTLGEEHDLAVLETVLPGLSVEDSARAPGLRELGLRRVELQERALAMGEEVYRESPGEFLEAMRSSWRRWQDQGNPGIRVPG